MTNQTDIEVWRPIKGYENLYEVSSLGKVASLHKNRIIMRSRSDRDGYRLINLWDGEKFSTRRVHHLVLENFIGDAPPGLICFHKNNNPGDNRVSNLLWATPKENTQHMIKCKRIRYRSKLTEKDVKEIKGLLRDGITQLRVGRLFDVSSRTISLIKLGKIWKTV